VQGMLSKYGDQRAASPGVRNANENDREITDTKKEPLDKSTELGKKSFRKKVQTVG